MFQVNSLKIYSLQHLKYALIYVLKILNMIVRSSSSSSSTDVNVTIVIIGYVLKYNFL